MVSGRQTLERLEEAVAAAGAQAAAVEAQMAALNQQLQTQRDGETKDYQDLAKLRLGQLGDTTLVERLDQTQLTVAALLAPRQTALTQLQAQLETAAAAARALAAQRADEAAAVDAAAQALDAAQARTQARLAADPDYQGRRERAQAAQRTAAQSEEKATQSAAEREQKGASYRADPLFMYLWERRFGLPEYRGFALTRYLDGKVARRIGFVDARANYDRLNAIPERLREHAATLKAQAEADFAVLRSLDEAARAADEVPALAAQLAQAQSRLAAIEARLTQAESEREALQAQTSRYTCGEDEHSQQALAFLAAELKRDDLLELRRAALATPAPDDDLIVARLMQADEERRRLEASMQGLREALADQQRRVAEAQTLCADFKTSRYDRAGSSFDNEALIATVLAEFLRGAVDRQQVWRTLQEQQRYRAEQSDPDFGSGGFGRGTVWS
ncbi:hypothetical protein [uncultured Thiodictyon sp.]|uniref:hypothetical protein n=1 Tax=uncultured Thiodictyon sp. TaxID=1846217 RepID=UPI0025F0ADE5|nr:hypothetical protein [uncultured Thiodictyon sp.]